MGVKAYTFLFALQTPKEPRGYESLNPALGIKPHYHLRVCICKVLEIIQLANTKTNVFALTLRIFLCIRRFMSFGLSELQVSE